MPKYRQPPPLREPAAEIQATHDFMHEEDREFARLINSERRRQFLTQRELAKRIQVSPSTLSGIETGRARPSRYVVAALTRALDLKGLNSKRDEARITKEPPGRVAVVLNGILPIKSEAAYLAFVSESQFLDSWPRDVRFLGLHTEEGHAVLSFSAPSALQIIRSMPILLQPFRLAGTIDWQDTFRRLSLSEGESVVEAFVNVPMLRSRIADRLRSCEGFATTVPKEFRVANEVVGVKIDSNSLAAASSPPPRPLHLTFVQGDQHMGAGDKFDVSGDLVAGAVGQGARARVRDVAVFKQDIDQSSRLDPDLKEKLKAARDELERVQLSDDDRLDVVENLEKLRGELAKPEKDGSRVTRFFKRIEEAAPTVASILSSAASLTKIISG
jgi:transcriptional regulator with XRE-family HTH domain